MDKKFKYTSLVAAGAVTLGLVGGTLAWFTSQAQETNVFSTGGNDFNDQNPNAGIQIVEDWNANKAQGITPGTTVNKDVQVQNTVNYPQFIKVNFTKQFVDSSGEVVTTVADETVDGGVYTLDTEKIELNVVKEHVVELTGDETEYNLVPGTWYKLGQDYYYYGKVASAGTMEDGKLIDYTNTLLDSVTLSSEADNHYTNLGFKVIVNAYSIQASNKAASIEWFAEYEELGNAFTSLESQNNTAPVDPLEGSSEDTNSGHNHK